MLGVVSVGDVANTRLPLPVSSVTAVAIWREVAVRVLFVRSIDLLVRVSVVARPTNVSVLVGRVSVPVFEIEDITGEVSVLLVSVSVVALPTNVSVLVGNVSVPVLTIEEITGDVRVLFVNVSVLARVARVPVVGSVTFVLAVEARVVANAPDVVRSPPKVMVLLPLLTPVPP